MSKNKRERENKMKISNKLNQQTFVEEIRSDDLIDNNIDMSEIRFADIFGIVSLIMLLKREYEKNNKINLYIPHNLNVANYLHVCGFIDYIKEYTNIKYNAFNVISKVYNTPVISNNKDYIPIQNIKNRLDVTNIVTNIINWLKYKNVEDKKIGQISTLLFELLQNSLNHGKSEKGCIFAMQKYQETLMISIADFGIGIKDCLETNINNRNLFSTNESAMKYIFTSNNYISSESDTGRGNGFFGLSKYINELTFLICTQR